MPSHERYNSSEHRGFKIYMWKRGVYSVSYRGETILSGFAGDILEAHQEARERINNLHEFWKSTILLEIDRIEAEQWLRTNTGTTR